MSKDQQVRNAADHEGHLRHWQQDKIRSGKWLSKEEYKKQVGKDGRKPL